MLQNPTCGMSLLISSGQCSGVDISFTAAYLDSAGVRAGLALRMQLCGHANASVRTSVEAQPQLLPHPGQEGNSTAIQLQCS